MRKAAKYAIFRTKWGYFGLAGSDEGLCRTQLPGPDYDRIKTLLLKDFPGPQFDKDFCGNLQEQITAYFEGNCAKFSQEIPLSFTGLSAFGISVLRTCSQIQIGKTMTYSRLAQKAGNPRACRAVGTALAKNPMPLIIPCHRVIRSDGKLGGFSAPGGIAAKKKLLGLERTIIGL
jgi:methylated-DNA-[protein]-cysteine S-methyltransferase